MSERPIEDGTLWAAEHFCGHGGTFERLVEVADRLGRDRLGLVAHAIRGFPKMWLRLEPEEVVTWHTPMAKRPSPFANGMISLQSKMLLPGEPSERHVVWKAGPDAEESLVLSRPLKVSAVLSSGPPHCWRGTLLQPRDVSLDQLWLDRDDVVRMQAPSKFVRLSTELRVVSRLSTNKAILLDILIGLATSAVRDAGFMINERPHAENLAACAAALVPRDRQGKRGCNAERWRKIIGRCVTATREDRPINPVLFDALIGSLARLAAEPVSPFAQVPDTAQVAKAAWDKLPAHLQRVYDVRVLRDVIGAGREALLRSK